MKTLIITTFVLLAAAGIGIAQTASAYTCRTNCSNTGGGSSCSCTTSCF